MKQTPSSKGQIKSEWISGPYFRKLMISCIHSNLIWPLLYSTNPKGFSASKFDEGNWILSKSYKFFEVLEEFFGNFLGGFFWRNFSSELFREEFFWINFLGGFIWKDFFGRIFGRIFLGGILWGGILCLHWNWLVVKILVFVKILG